MFPDRALPEGASPQPMGIVRMQLPTQRPTPDMQEKEKASQPLGIPTPGVPVRMAEAEEILTMQAEAEEVTIPAAAMEERGINRDAVIRMRVVLQGKSSIMLRLMARYFLVAVVAVASKTTDWLRQVPRGVASSSSEQKQLLPIAVVLMAFMPMGLLPITQGATMEPEVEAPEEVSF
jgi:hypothetical protein